MGSDAIANGRLSAFARDSAKKKKGGRLGKVKQNKVDVRKGQWIRQVNKKVWQMGLDSMPSTNPNTLDQCKAQVNMSMKAKGGDEHQSIIGSWPSKKMNFTGTKGRRRRRSSCSSFGSSEGERDQVKDCLDNWEAMVDALPSSDNTKNPNAKPKPEPERVCIREDVGTGHGCVGTTSAWTVDDSCGPQSLPRVSLKQEEQQQQRSQKWKKESESGGLRRFDLQESVVSEEPSACPICCEDFDVTDSGFLPCVCGFRLCLFCHKRILEVDARCPGCRKDYESVGLSPEFDSLAVVAYSMNLSKKIRF